MVNATIDAVAKQLGKTFGKNYHYYYENVNQSLATPCFTIDVLMPLERSKSPKLYDRTMPIVIHYFTNDDKNPKRDCNKIGEQILECLEYLPFKNTILRGENISTQMVDDVLQIFITYKFTTVKEDEVYDAMENLETTTVRTN